MSDFAALLIAFAAGILSFLSPCVLPLIPGYLSFMTGLSASELAEGRDRVRIVGPALLFVLGFSAVFVSLGATASIVGQFLLDYRVVIERVAGGLIILFGILMLGIIKMPWLYGEARVDLERSRSFGKGAAFVMGAAFAAGWTPCVGPILGSILTMAGSSGSVGKGALLLLSYSLGFGVPFIAVALLFSRLRGPLRWLSSHALAVNRVAGALLVLVGLLILTGQFGVVATWLTGLLPAVELELPTIAR